MSPQPSPIRRFPLEDVGETGSLIFAGSSGSPLTIPKALIAKMWGQADEGVRMAPNGGVEVGGLLVGPKSREGGVVVGGIIPLPIDYQHGPSFRLSASDRVKVGVLVESVQTDPSKAVVGFYRSHSRGDNTFRDSDREIFEAIEKAHSSFAADFLYYCVLAPVSKTEVSARIFTWSDESRTETQFTLRSNPFSVVQTSTSAVRQVSSPAEEQGSRPLEAHLAPSVQQRISQLAAEHGTPLPEPQLNTVERPSKPAFGRLWYAAAGLLLVVVAAGGYRWFVKNRAQPATGSQAQASAPPLRMGFSANPEGPVWKLSWDRGALEQIKASGAVLVIEDGNNEQVLSLTPADLSSGTIFYTPQGGDLVFILKLDRADANPLEERIRVLGSGPGVQKVAGRGPQTVPDNTAVQSKAGSRDPSPPIEVSRPSSSGISKTKAFNPILSSSARANPGPSETAVIRDAPPSLAETPRPSAVAFAIPVAPRLTPPVDIAPPPTPSPQPAVPPITPSAASPATSNVPPPVIQPSAAAPPPVNANYVNPKPIQQIRPQPSVGMNASGVQIQIRVEIDARGKVTKATPIGVSVANPTLLFMTVRAARSWEFEPAKMDGRPVASEMDLVFRF